LIVLIGRGRGLAGVALVVGPMVAPVLALVAVP